MVDGSFFVNGAEMIKRILVRLLEDTVGAVQRKQRSITRLFPTFPQRVKDIGSMGGIRLVDMEMDLWHFKAHSGTESGLWYDCYIRFKDLEDSIRTATMDKRLWIRDGSRIDMRKLSSKVLQDTEVEVKCSCPAFLYWGPAYILTRRSAKYTEPETRPPRIRNPRQYGAVCKHLAGVLKVYPFYATTAARWIREFYSDIIAQAEWAVLKREKELGKATKFLGKRMQEVEPEKGVGEGRRVHSVSEGNWQYGDFITLKPDAEVINSVTGKPVPAKWVRDGGLWAIDAYEDESGMLNINRVLDPYPGAYCSWVHEDDVVFVKHTFTRKTPKNVEERILEVEQSKKEQWFVDRTNRHISLVQEA